MFSQLTGIIFLLVGFGFVIFWHELGHFLAAKAVGIKVEQFAVGFGQAILAWRKGLGFRVGTTRPEYEKRVTAWLKEHRPTVTIDDENKLTLENERDAATALNISETEYRLNWIPLGGYVKMLGQDDLDPNAQSGDPRSFNRKSISARMLVVSAGVIMNIILAAIGFAVVFGAGFDRPPAVVGNVQQGSPAHLAGLQPGDRIAYINDDYQHDFTMLAPNIALAGRGSNVKLKVQKPDGSYVDVNAAPQRPPSDPKGFLVLGIEPATELAGLPDTDAMREVLKQSDLHGDMLKVQPGDRIVAVNGRRLEPVTPADRTSSDAALREKNLDAKRKNLLTFDQAVQSSKGQPIELTILTSKGEEKPLSINPSFGTTFDGSSTSIAGMTPRVAAASVMPDSPVQGKMQSGDIFEEITIANPASPTVLTPTIQRLKETLNAAGEAGEKITLKVLRDGKPFVISDIKTVGLPSRKYGLKIALDQDVNSPVVSDVAKDSPADRAGIPRGALITQINNTPVKNWFDIREALATLTVGQSATIQVAGADKPLTLPGLTQQELDAIKAVRYDVNLQLDSLSVIRQTSNPIAAVAWGVGATKDLLIQTYISLQRLIDGSVPASGMMGPVGIFNAGTGFAARSNVWLVWFLSMISANLAVVNFLPIPIVDGGLFMFLILEKIRGKPLSQRVQTAAQIVGLALLGFVFVFATWQDITRIIWG